MSVSPDYFGKVVDKQMKLKVCKRKTRKKLQIFQNSELSKEKY